MGRPRIRPGPRVASLVADQNTLVEEAGGEIGDAGRAHAEMLPDLHPRQGAFPAKAIEKPPSGGFAGAERDRRHVASIYSNNEKNNTIKSQASTK